MNQPSGNKTGNHNYFPSFCNFGNITFTFLDADDKKRADPADLIEAVKAAAK